MDPMAMKNIEYLVDGVGEVTIGCVGPIRCAAIAADGDQMLAALVRQPAESLQKLLARLDAALDAVWEGGDPVDEINAPPNPPMQRPARARRGRGR